MPTVPTPTPTPTTSPIIPTTDATTYETKQGCLHLTLFCLIITIICIALLVLFGDFR